MRAMKRFWIIAMAASLICVAPGCSKDNDPTPPPDEKRKDHADADGKNSNRIFKLGHTTYKFMGNGIMHVNLLFDGEYEESQITDTLTIPSSLKITYKYGLVKTFRVTAVDLNDGDPRYNHAPEISYSDKVSCTWPTVIISEGIDSLINLYPMIYQTTRNKVSLQLKDLWLPKTLKYIGPNAFFEKYRDRAGNHYDWWSYWSFEPYAKGLRIHVPNLESWCAVEVDDTQFPPRAGDIGAGYIFPQYTLCIGNDSVSDLVIPASITKIGPRAFSGASIKSVRMHDGVRSIGNFAFSQCKNLESAELPAGLGEISLFVFYNCRKLSTIKLPNGVRKIGRHAFDLAKIDTLEMPDGLETIEDNSFAMCDLKELYIPSSVKTVGDSAFFNAFIRKLTVAPGKRKFGYGVFQQCFVLTEVNLPSDFGEISDAMFSKCTSLKRIELPSGLKTIGEKAFEESGLEEVRIPEGVTTIGEDAFNNCKNLKTVFLPKSLKKIGAWAFYCESWYSADSLTDVYCFSETPPESGYAIFNDDGKGKNLYVPAGAEERYRADEHWCNFNIHGIDVTAVGQVKAAAKDGEASFYDLSGRLIGKGKTAADARRLAAPGTVVIMAGNGGSRKIVVE